MRIRLRASDPPLDRRQKPLRGQDAAGMLTPRFCLN
jgi:hypothetical protein